MRHITANTLFYGDNLPVLREHIADASVDLVYLDPPFNSNRNYNILFKDEHGKDSDAQVQAFADTWSWNDAAEHVYHELVMDGPPQVGQMIGAMRQFIGTNQMMAYLVMMAARLVELHRVLKPTGSLYLHCDPTASHYLKILLDTIFDPRNFRAEINWKRTAAHNDSKRWAALSDVILNYSKTNNFTWNPQYVPLKEDAIPSRYRHKDSQGRAYHLGPMDSPNPRPNLMYEWKGYQPPKNGWRYSRERMAELDAAGEIWYPSDKTGRLRRKLYLDESKGSVMGNIWTDITPLQASAAERLGYPTQKPLALLERIINASSNPGDVILDPFCGCGTAIAAAEKLGRRWLGIDVTHLAIAIQKSRLKEMFPGIAYNVVGEPLDVASARVLAQQDRYQFQWWALSLVQARPLGGEAGSKQGKKGSDRGIDGIIPFIDEQNGKPKRALVQVKSGTVKSGDIRDLRGTLEREGAPLGGFITLDEPTTEMRREAAAAGVYRSPGWNRDYPRLQILTVKELLHGAEMKMPPTVGPFKTAQRAEGDDGQQSLPL